MNYKSKYLIIDTGMVVAPVVFTDLLTHADIARSIRGEVLGAGFCHIQDNLYVCYGESV